MTRAPLPEPLLALAQALQAKLDNAEESGQGQKAQEGKKPSKSR